MEHLFQSISELANFIDASKNHEETLLRLTHGVCGHSDWDISSIQVLDPVRERSIPIMRYDPLFQDAHLPLDGWHLDHSPIGQVLQSGHPLVLPDAANQDDFPAFRDDALRRKYHTVVILPLKVKDDDGRAMVYSVASRDVIKLTDADLGFLKCIADLTNIAFRKMRALRDEALKTERMRDIVERITTSLTNSLDTEASGSLASDLSGLFPSGWLAVDLTSGRVLLDPENPPPVPVDGSRRVPEFLVTAALAVREEPNAARDIQIGGRSIKAQVRSLMIDGSHVGALFFFESNPLSDSERLAADAGRLALSSFILRRFVEFKSRRGTAKRLISKLFEQDWRDIEDIEDEAHRLDFDLSQPTRLLVMQTPTDALPDDGAQSSILRSAQAVFGPALFCVIDTDIILLLTDHGQSFGPEAQAKFLSRIRPFIDSGTLLTMSQTQPRIEDIAASKAFCARTLQVARKLNVQGWVSPTTVGEFPALMASSTAGAVDEFLKNVLMPLLGSTPRRSVVVLETLNVFLKSGRRYQEAADELGVHVSTLRYRVEKIAAEHGIDFSNHDVCFDLECAIRVYQLQNSYET